VSSISVVAGVAIDLATTLTGAGEHRSPAPVM
jgi:hypothetical protein